MFPSFNAPASSMRRLVIPQDWAWGRLWWTSGRWGGMRSCQVVVGKRVAASLGLVEDAAEEVEETMSGKGGKGREAVEFTAVERELVREGVGSCGLAGPDRIQALDEIAQLAQECSHCVDDLAHCVGAPIRLLDFSAAASAVVAKSQAFLAVAGSIADTASGTW
ncbi:hypothetical protein BDK51DRAFT_30988 [Blyttiomyces helicus]|uniref:Uncharacterized protein n=1 Tax=Blyttiomyces helicus TaxID=388810 RepID=A0A4P9WHF8_9FUNG|nr:hypothetical protein BDK51DRAFT_30988 [Blyttiomyces helicus]|eukprot:RKO91375.1 hypothetical protein BDK51DRAFT_30988 [Blyttiomyces helicus]